MKSTHHKYYTADAFHPLPFKDESVDLIVTSPPYPMVQMWDESFGNYMPELARALEEQNGPASFEIMHELLDKTWSESYRLLREGGFLCINIGDATRTINKQFRIYHNHSRINTVCHKIGFDTLPSIIWRKPTNAPNKFMGSGMLPAGAYVTLEHEYILIMRKGGKRSFTKEERQNRNASAIFWEERNLWFSDQWTDVKGTRQKLNLDSLRTRSAAYPIEIPLRLIQMYSTYGDVVLDPFSGTGTTSLAAMISGRNSLSIDNDKQLVKSTIKFSTKRKTKNTLNQQIKKRLINHMKYVHSKDMLFFRYKNEPHGFPVKTLQERALTIRYIKSMTRNDEDVQVKYRKPTSTEINQIIHSSKSE